MELDIRIKMNEHLYLKDPYESVLGRKIVKEGLLMINRLGFEAFTFKKLAIRISTTEAGIYRYFENKHKLLLYLVNWYWSYTQYQIDIKLNNLTNPRIQLKTIIELLVTSPEQNKHAYIPVNEVYRLVLWEASKSYLTRNVVQLNKDQLFKPYKELTATIAAIIRKKQSRYKYPYSLASTILEMSHAQKFFMQHLPSLTDHKKGSDKEVVAFIEDFTFRVLGL